MNKFDNLNLPINVYILLSGGIISAGDTFMDNGKNVGGELQSAPQKNNEYKVTYHFDKNAKINLNEILKKSFLLSLKTEGKM